MRKVSIFIQYRACLNDDEITLEQLNKYLRERAKGPWGNFALSWNANDVKKVNPNRSGMLFLKEYW